MRGWWPPHRCDQDVATFPPLPSLSLDEAAALSLSASTPSADSDDNPNNAPFQHDNLSLGEAAAAAVIPSTEAPSTDRDANTNNAPFQNVNAKQRRRQSNAARQAGLKIAVEAVASGTSITSAMAIGNIVAKDKNRSYSNITKQGYVGRPAQSAPTNPSNAIQHGGGFGNRKKLYKTSPYLEGEKAGTEASIAAPRPDGYNKKCLVISGIEKSVTKSKFIEDLNRKAERDIDISHIEVLSKSYNPWLTVAIELSEDDYTELFDSSFWEIGMRIRPYIGRKFWRGLPRLTPQQIKNAVRDQWSKE